MILVVGRGIAHARIGHTVGLAVMSHQCSAIRRQTKVWLDGHFHVPHLHLAKRFNRLNLQDVLHLFSAYEA